MSWKTFIAQQKQMDYYKNLQLFLDEQENMGKTIYPQKSLRFNALDLTPLESVKVVILGQYPYTF